MDFEEISKKKLDAVRHRERLFRIHSYPRYLWHSFRESRIYQRSLNLWINFRRYRLISRIITVLATILTFLSTGAATLLFALLALIVLPIAALLVGGTMLLGFFRREHQNRMLFPEVNGRTVYLFIPEELHHHSFSAGTMQQFAARPDSTVFVISPYTWSARGIGGEGFYINARQEQAHLFLLRRHYFFFFRRLLTQRKNQRIVVIL